MSATNLHSSFALLALVVGACGQPTITATPVFNVGQADDPVLQMALLAYNTETLALRVRNSTAHAFAAGLVTTTPLFNVNGTPSTALRNYATAGSAATGDAHALAAALGLTVGVNAFVVPAVAAGATHDVTAEFPKNAKLSFVARVDGTTDDLVGVRDASQGPASGSHAMRGYTIDVSLFGLSVRVVQGNGSTGTNPSNTSVSYDNLASCNGANAGLNRATRLLAEPFTAQANTSANWPANIGWAGDFGGDWSTDGVTARMQDVNAPRPGISGIVKFMSICPRPGATLSVSGDVVTQYTRASSDTTLVVYFLTSSGSLISTAANHPLHNGNAMTFGLYDVAIPANARRIAVAPMAFQAAGETGSAFYSRIDVDYTPAAAVTSTTLLNDDFATYEESEFGKNQPLGWGEFGGDWFVHPDFNHATVWNTSWGDNQTPLPPIDTGMFKTIPLTGLQAGDSLDVSLFVAATFADPTSFVRLRAVFDAGDAVEGDRLHGTSFSTLQLRRAAIPAGATSVTLIVNAYLGAAETSSVYVDDLRVALVR